MDMTQNEACKLHQDWSFILQEQDAQALLQLNSISIIG
jgi:exodeoxyribonuclease V gamma subunit